MRLFCIAILMLSIPCTANPQDLSKVKVETTQLSDSVYMLRTRAGGNHAVCKGDDGTVLVDTDYTGLGEKIKTAVAGITDRPVNYVINTHWHFDHVGGNAWFKKEGALIVAHENVRKRMAEDQHIDIIDTDVQASPIEALPDITFSSSITLRMNGEEIQVRHFPNAHTDGDGVVHFPASNVIHTGDLFFNPGYPFIDVSNGGNVNGVIAALEQILLLCDDETKIIPGHGPLSDRKGLKDYLGMIKEFRSIIAGEIESGNKLEKIQAARPTEALDRKWGRAAFPPDLFTEMVFRSLHDDRDPVQAR